MKRVWYFGALALVLCVSCAVNPVTGKKELNLISEQRELALGQETDAQVRAEYGVYEDAGLTGYVMASGTAMGPHTHRPKMVYHFAVLDTPVINAFAAPGGYIYVTRGILALMSSEAELEVVLGHELGHVNARHTARKLSQMILVQAGLAIGSAVSETFAKISGLAGIGVQLLFLKFSRDDEREADHLGVEYSRSAGYDPSRMVVFFTSLERMGDLSGKGHALPGFLSTHPLTSERIRNVKALVLESDAKLKRRDEEYARKIDGLVFGDDPRQGYVEGSAFYHPGLRFSLAVPEGWKIQNTPGSVQLTSGNGEAAIVLQSEKSPEDLASFARKKAAQLEGGKFVTEQPGNVHGLTCLHQIYDIAQPEKENVRAKLSFIRKGDRIYTLAAVSTSARWSGHEADFRRTADSFQELKDPARLSKQPLRLKMVRADGTTSLRNLLEKAGIGKDLWPQLAIMNGLALEASPAVGRLIKTVR
jgi:predicted Zn-dependent protease